MHPLIDLKIRITIRFLKLLSKMSTLITQKFWFLFIFDNLFLSEEMEEKEARLQLLLLLQLFKKQLRQQQLPVPPRPQLQMQLLRLLLQVQLLSVPKSLQVRSQFKPTETVSLILNEPQYKEFRARFTMAIHPSLMVLDSVYLFRSRWYLDPHPASHYN